MRYGTRTPGSPHWASSEQERTDPWGLRCHSHPPHVSDREEPNRVAWPSSTAASFSCINLSLVRGCQCCQPCFQHASRQGGCIRYPRVYSALQSRVRRTVRNQRRAIPKRDPAHQGNNAGETDTYASGSWRELALGPACHPRGGMEYGSGRTRKFPRCFVYPSVNPKQLRRTATLKSPGSRLD